MHATQSSHIAGDNPAGRTRNRVRQSRDKNPDAPDMNTQPHAERTITSSGIGPPVPVAIPAQVQAHAPCVGAFAEPSGRPPRQNFAVPKTTIAQASSSVSFLLVGENEQNSPSGGGREEERNVVGNTNRENSPAGSVRMSDQNQVQVPEVEESEANLMDQNTSPSRITPNRQTSGSRESEEHFELT